jgi:MFS family permease
MITAACSDLAGLATCRFLLGVFEAVIMPAWMLIVGQWYNLQEKPAQAGAIYCCNGMGNLVGGMFFHGVGHAKNFPCLEDHLSSL